ncbi:MAG: cyclic nucleotide-binding domain-containing protein [Gammaproteobacteria bacterium]|nr:cyclic nucleotide-binding domain-containing protein [Gammaproteobacteria bacterium]
MNKPQPTNEVLNFLKENELFLGLTQQQLETLSSELTEIHVNKGDIIIHENELNDDLYIIKEGEVEITKFNNETNLFHRLNIETKGAVLGEMTLIDNFPRSATVRATQPTTLLVLSIQKLRTLETKKNCFVKWLNYFKKNDMQPIYAIMVQNISKNLAKRLRSTNATAVVALKNELLKAKAHNAMSDLIINTLILLSVYIFSLQLFLFLRSEIVSTTFITIPLMIFLVTPLIYMVRNSGYPLSVYGLTFNNWRRSVYEAIIFTTPVLLLILLCKALLIRYTPSFAGQNLISFSFDLTPVAANAHVSYWVGGLLVFLYLIFVPVQEFLTRGVLQSSFQILLTGRHRTIWAIVLSNLLFSAMHSHVSFAFEFVVMIPGLFWGWMYARHGTLIGVTLSHLIIGAWVLFVVGLL